MSYVLAYTKPDGTSLALAPVTSIPAAGRQARRLLQTDGRQFLTWNAIDRYVDLLVATAIQKSGTAELTTHTGWTLRIDKITAPEEN